MFELNSILERDSILVGNFPLSQLRLINDSQFPWLILVPQRNGVSEMHHLVEKDRQQLMSESCLLAEVLHDAFSADKLNVAAIGNKVPQLHLHHVVRFETDICWPEPVWGKVPAVPYGPQALSDVLEKIRSLLNDDLTLPDNNAELYY
ncbi:HIT domain-containing protein [Marinomonas pollencensis]|uniref:Diadenosine tetraphosphate (Ap4A) HIT family hydrolase n=1 Tax=Marinomonas pollencensis TaxID=491954 RepID=A0A3E0D6I4_9GAMM|nr:HIT domain-containing protein [Marinomonas pollencensis]REG78266.1 diadenosine tetraphosphate (Ap4A) HIT family hydrolase [Marinomonas pollencensis]